MIHMKTKLLTLAAFGATVLCVGAARADTVGRGLGENFGNSWLGAGYSLTSRADNSHGATLKYVSASQNYGVSASVLKRGYTLVSLQASGSIERTYPGDYPVGRSAGLVVLRNTTLFSDSKAQSTYHTNTMDVRSGGVLSPWSGTLYSLPSVTFWVAGWIPVTLSGSIRGSVNLSNDGYGYTQNYVPGRKAVLERAEATIQTGVGVYAKLSAKAGADWVASASVTATFGLLNVGYSAKTGGDTYQDVPANHAQYQLWSNQPFGITTMNGHADASAKLFTFEVFSERIVSWNGWSWNGDLAPFPPRLSPVYTNTW
jgi:hypothetical protein